MQSGLHEDKSFTLEVAIAKLQKNDPDFKKLSLSSIIMNPTIQEAEVPGGESLTVSHIRDDDLFQLAEALEQNKTLVNIEIDGTGPTRSLEWTYKGAEAIGESLKNHLKLKYVNIDLMTDDLTENEIAGFLNCLTGSANIHVFSLSTHCNTSSFMNCLGKYLGRTQRLDTLSIWSRLLEESIDEEKKETPFKNFAIGLSAQKNLRHLLLHEISLGDEGIKEISKAMQRVTSLEIIDFFRCQIKNETKQVCYMALNNPALKKLSLSCNPLEEEGIKDIARALPAFRNLEILDLQNTGLNNAALDFLVSTCVEYKLNIVDLNIGSHKVNDRFLNSIMKLIDKNPTLKRLRLDYCDIKDLQLEKLCSLLMDPKRCFLEGLSFWGNQALSGGAYNMLLTVLRSNKFLHDLRLPRHSYEHQTLCDVNRIKKRIPEWQMFITITLYLFNAHYLEASVSSTDKILHLKLSSLPLELMYSILLFIAPIEDENTFPHCMERIKSNLEYRQRRLIKRKKYNLADYKNQRIKWWSNSFKDSKGIPRLLFMPKSVISVELMESKDIVVELKPFLQKLIVVSSDGDKECISLNLSHLTTERQLYVRDVFNRFFRIILGEDRDIDSRNIPTADVHRETRDLIIQGTTLEMLKKDIKRALGLPLAPRISEVQASRCNIM